MPGLNFDERLGVRLVQSADGQAVVELKVEEAHLNSRGIVHGGVFCSLIDDAIGAAVHSLLLPDGQATTADLTVHFLRPGSVTVIRAEGRVVRQGRRLIVGEAAVYDDHGTLLARGVGTWAVLRSPTRGD